MHSEKDFTAIIAELAEVKAERDALRKSPANSAYRKNHEQARCIQETAAALGPDCSTTVKGLPKAARKVARQLKHYRKWNELLQAGNDRLVERLAACKARDRPAVWRMAELEADRDKLKQELIDMREKAETAYRGGLSAGQTER